jgi:hypothetical protein
MMFCRTSVKSACEKHKELDAMRIFIAPLVIGTLALAGASPASAQTKPVSDQGVSVGVATSRDSTAEKSIYKQKAQDEVRVWQQKLNDFDAKVQTKATEAQASASKDLDDAWTQTKMASARLETAGEADWVSAKASFKTASAKLAVAWRKVNPSDK